MGIKRLIQQQQLANKEKEIIEENKNLAETSNTQEYSGEVSHEHSGETTHEASEESSVEEKLASVVPETQDSDKVERTDTAEGGPAD